MAVYFQHRENHLEVNRQDSVDGRLQSGEWPLERVALAGDSACGTRWTDMGCVLKVEPAGLQMHWLWKHGGAQRHRGGAALGP